MTDRTDPPGAEADPSLDRYARIVCRALDVPAATVTIVEPGRQVFAGAVGLPEPYQTTREVPLTHSFCQFVVKNEQPMVIPDARLDDQLRDNPAIDDLLVVAYAGWPLTDADGRVVGSLCAIDHRPRDWTARDLATLEDLSGACSAELAERHLRRVAGATAAIEQAIATQSQVLLALSEALSNTRTVADIAAAVDRVAVEGLDCNHAGIWLLNDPGSGTPDRLWHAGNPGHPWVHAQRNSVFALDDTNPLGACLLERRMLTFHDRAEQDLLYPDTVAPGKPREGEARVMAPLSNAAADLGCLVLVWPRARDFDRDDRLLFQALARYTAQAVEGATLLADRAHVATTLQTAMLSDLPQPDDLELVARYRPAAEYDEVGGDWYDAIVTPDGSTKIMIGDVAGHNIEAAAIMGQLRSMLRAFAWDHDDGPAANVARLDRAMRDLHIRRSASLILARVEQTDTQRPASVRTLRWTNAGHVAPILLAPDGSTRFLDDGAPADTMLGVDATTRRHDQTVEVLPGSTLVLYTDGLVERRHERLQTGLDKLADALRRAAAATAGEPLGSFVDHVLEGMLDSRQDDDVTVLAVRFNAQPARG